MVLDAASFAEEVHDNAPSTASFSLANGRAHMAFILPVNMTQVADYGGPVFNESSQVQPLDLLGMSQVILGGVNTDVGDGRLNRILPFAHPQWPWLYAEGYSVQGIGAPVLTASISPLEALQMPAFALYPTYRVTMEFTNRNYAVLNDFDIETATYTWWDVDGSTQENLIAMEWLRFTDYQAVPQNDWVTASIGNGFVFVTEGGSGDSKTDPNNAPYAGMPRILLPNEIIKMTWRQVPFRYYSSPNSFLRRFRGRINQFAWYNWGKGELLYLNCNPIRFTPPILQPANWLLGATTVDKWCDLELFFLATRREGVNVPTPENNNFIAAGHNLMPWQADNQFYYTQSPNPPLGTGAPTFYSFPFELLWTDPDVGSVSAGDAGEPDVFDPDDVDPVA